VTFRFQKDLTLPLDFILGIGILEKARHESNVGSNPTISFEGYSQMVRHQTVNLTKPKTERKGNSHALI